jgi:hypothetical protein
VLGKVLVIAGLVAPIIVTSANAEQSAIKLNPLLAILPSPLGYNTVNEIEELSPGNCTDRHTHPGIANGYVVEGDIILKVEGKPDQIVKAGGSFETQPFSSTAIAGPGSGTRCTLSRFMRSAGMVHRLTPRSISLRWAGSVSLVPVTVRTRNSSARAAVAHAGEVRPRSRRSQQRAALHNAASVY